MSNVKWLGQGLAEEQFWNYVYSRAPHVTPQQQQYAATHRQFPFPWLGSEGVVGQHEQPGTLGATCPAEVAKFAPPFCKDWNNMSDAEHEDAIIEAGTIRDQYEQTLAYLKSRPGVCNATQPGTLANALRGHLVDKGGDKAKLSKDGEAFGTKGDIDEWKRVFGEGPTKAQAKAAFGVPWASPYGSPTINLDTVCPGGVTLPAAPVVTAPAPPVTSPATKVTTKKGSYGGWGLAALAASLVGALWYAQS